MTKSCTGWWMARVSQTSSSPMHALHPSEMHLGCSHNNTPSNIPSTVLKELIMNKCINLERTSEAAPLSLSLPSSQGEQPKSAIGITITQPSPRYARKWSLIGAEPRIDHKKTSSKPITAIPCSRKRQRSRKKATVRFAAFLHETYVVPRWTKDEARSSWYSKRDILAFQCQEATDAAILRVIIQATPAIENLPQEPAVYRGLERLLSPQIASEISSRKKGCVISVLVAQHRGLNMDLIAEVSRNISDNGADWALTLGSI